MVEQAPVQGQEPVEVVAVEVVPRPQVQVGRQARMVALGRKGLMEALLPDLGQLQQQLLLEPHVQVQKMLPTTLP